MCRILNTALLLYFLGTCNALSQRKQKFIIVTPSDSVVSQSRALPLYESIQVNTGLQVLIDSAQKDNIMVKGPENLLNLVETSVKNKTLLLGVKPGYIFHGVSVVVPPRPLRRIEATGGAKITSNNIVNADELVLIARSGSVIELTLEALRIECEAVNGGELRLKGESKDAVMISKNGSKIDALNLVCRAGHLSLRDGARIVCQFLENISVSTDQSSILLKGSPSVLFEKKPRHYQIQYLSLSAN
jgi:hypothetical protein